MLEEDVEDEELVGHLNAGVNDPYSDEDTLMSLVELTVLRCHLREDVDAGGEDLERDD